MTIIKADEFNRVCRLGGLMQVGKLNTWATEKKEEGIELNVQGKILTFSYKDGERNYNVVIIDKRILSVLRAFEKEINGETKQEPAKETKQEKREEVKSQGSANENKNEVHKDKAQEAQSESNKVINSIPSILEEKRIITFLDLEELKKQSLFNRLLLFQKTPKQLIRKRRGFLLPTSAKKDKKDLTDIDYMMFQYVPANIMNQEANLAFLFEVSWVVEDRKYFENPFEILVSGYIQVKINGEIVRRPCGGSMIQKGSMDKGDVMEGAISEMKKRGLKSFGFNADVYRQDGEIDDSM